MLAIQICISKPIPAASLLGLSCLLKPNPEEDEEDHSVTSSEKGSFLYGCQHYRRKCKIRAPCCNEFFDCRHCHNEAKSAGSGSGSCDHDTLVRQNVAKVICSICETEQDVQQFCQNCGVCMGEYFCSKCKFFDDDVSKQQFHCDKCGICRVGGKENFFHCEKCGCCYSVSLQNKHICVEKSMEQNCPICYEYLFDSLKAISVMRCGHTMHSHCLDEMQSHSQYSCPVCSKSVFDMSNVWRHLDQEIAVTPMPEAYRNKMVWILCNDCGATSEVGYHVIGHKCINCNSYNTRQTKIPTTLGGY
ncbi:hypothetical protein KP509_07G005500 [Ceratopteris richardii]|uniref:Uncharacterized protein n=1 Tax=Ceratopteris richardii TaxID=49495 RepID=A0A8T2UBZ7_CERRI|nr:hypothetical protein KP509_07G005500 [Ceratopteris richardii]KAH7432044.1 hypothetical protein KP509_07G005500 [Ceratopteris richardii]KAH7432048.1 hypothetical protein KP509_07G005500 [Ceratopteris richardii]KAH7432050.1 hypothetical protein KP509_07G005500 [Ceratopteris richardii]